MASPWQVVSPAVPLPHPVQVCDDRAQTWPVPQPVLSWQVPVTQTPPLQMWPAPYSFAHCVSPAAPALQAPQANCVCAPQIVPVAAQSPLTRQLPAMQEPALQTWFAPYAPVQSAFEAQALQLLAVQTLVVSLQSAATWQLPVVQPPEMQTWPLAHWLSVVQLTQVLLVQIWPLLQPVLSWQLPITQLLPTQMRPSV